MYRRKGLVLAAVLILAATGSAYGQDCVDRDGDGDFDLDDFAIVKSGFGRTFLAGTGGDITGDRRCDLSDLAAVKRWLSAGECPHTPVTVERGEMELFIDVTRTAFLHNPTDHAIMFSGYEVRNATRYGSPSFNMAAWDSIVSDPTAAVLEFGNEVISFARMSYDDTVVAEFSLGAEVCLDPGVTFSLGRFTSGVFPRDITFLYATDAAPDGAYLGWVSSESGPGDVDADGDVDLDDFVMLKNSFSTGGIQYPWTRSDCDGDGDIDLDDFVILKFNFGTDWSTGNVPEPATLSLLAIGGLAAVCRKR